MNAVFSLLLRPSLPLRRIARAGLLLACGATAFAAEPTAAQLNELLEHNRRLEAQVRAQEKTIAELNAKVSEIVLTNARHERELRGLSDRTSAEAASEAGGAAPGAGTLGRGANELRIAAEAGLTYFHTGRNGQFPNGEFRADDPVLSVEAPVWKDVYFFSELKLQPRETNVEEFELGEIYVDFERVLGRWGHPDALNVRAGRLNIPFGEEYLRRSPTVNPLISHSLSDTWGVDEGIEAYGSVGAAQYVVAVQNGGVSRLHDYDRDKAVAARIGWQAAHWLHVSGSAMRTGRLSTAGDGLSELWFGNGFIRALGPSSTTNHFRANLYELDASTQWPGGNAHVALGQVSFDDNDSRAENARRIRFGYLEATQQIAGELFAAARYSEIRAAGGYPLAGWAPLGAFFFRPGALTEELHRLSVGLGYRFAPPLVLKIEYAWESGRMTSGAARDHEDFFGTQLGVKF